jgi:hypothetical protein
LANSRAFENFLDGGDAMAGRPTREPYWHMLNEVMSAVATVEPKSERTRKSAGGSFN